MTSRLHGVRVVALMMVLTAVVAFAVTSANVAACNCQQNQECSLGTGCYSDGACAPAPRHERCEVTASGQGWYCHWVADIGCSG